MADPKQSGERPPEYRYQLLRYSPRPENGEFYNIGVVLYDAAGQVVDARFAPDFRRMRCNPAVDVAFLEALRHEFDESRLLGENFSGFLEQVIERPRNSIEATDPKSVFCADAAAEIERFVERYLSTPPGLEDAPGPGSGQTSRSAVRRRMTEAFARQGLFRNGHGVQRDIGVEYGPSGLRFVFDFQYRPPEADEHFIQALGLRAPDAEAGRLCFVLQEYRAKSRGQAGLTVVADDSLGDDVRNLLGDRGVGAVNLSALDAYAGTIRKKLRL